MVHRIYYDGWNLALPRGTGIATYSRVLIRLAREFGHDVGILYSIPRSPADDPLLREVAFFAAPRPPRPPTLGSEIEKYLDRVRALWPIRPAPVEASGAVLRRAVEADPVTGCRLFASREVFRTAVGLFEMTGRFTTLAFAERPDVFHFTFPTPVRAAGARNVYTIHDLVPLRLPFASGDNKRTTYTLLKKIAADADHIVTVSESARRDIVEILGVSGDRVTNTYQAAMLPDGAAERPDGSIANELAALFGLEFGGYLLFYGALEPKKNVGRIIEAYFRSGVGMPLVLVTGGGWGNDVERALLGEVEAHQASRAAAGKPSVRRLDYVGAAALAALIRGARAGIFPSLYEGFGLPVLECMTLGTPVVTSREGSLPEIAGDAALLVDPYDVGAIATALRTIVNDGDLRAELSRRSRVQAEQFSLSRYRDRVKQLYDRIL